MNKTTEALKLAGKALGCSQQHLDLYHPEWVITRQQNDKALAAIREALAEQEKQEPVAVISESAIGLVKLHSNGACLPFGTQLYAAPVSVEAAVLSEREACAKVCEAKQSYNAMHANTEFAAAIRARSEK